MNEKSNDPFVRQLQSAASVSHEQTEGHESANNNDTLACHGTTTGKQIPLPNYSTRVRDVLSKGQVLLDFDHFIEETAYHIIAHGDMTLKAEYEEYGKRLLLEYPCLEFPGRKHDWVMWSVLYNICLCDK